MKSKLSFTTLACPAWNIVKIVGAAVANRYDAVDFIKTRRHGLLNEVDQGLTFDLIQKTFQGWSSAGATAVVPGFIASDAVSGEITTLVVSKVANFSIDLPEASVAVQVSGTFGSRQEEAQRLGRLLRPKHDGGQAHFYSVVSRDTLDAEYAAHRQRFLAEQGYAYRHVFQEPHDGL